MTHFCVILAQTKNNKMMKTSLRILLLTALALLTACEKGGTVRQIVYTVDAAAE